MSHAHRGNGVGEMAGENNIGVRLLAIGEPDERAVHDSGRWFTYRDLRQAAAIVGRRLTAAGLRPGAHVGLVGANSFFWVSAYLATIAHGYVSVPLSAAWTPRQMARNARWVQCDAVIFDRRLVGRFGAAFDDNVPVITDDVIEGAGSSEGGLADPPDGHEGRRHDTDPDQDAVLLFTSGTTSRPKAVRVTHRNIGANTDSIVEALGLRPSDRMLTVLPFSYCFGASLLHTHLAVGASLVLCNTLAFPQTVVEMIDAHRCTGLAGVPSTYQLLLRRSSLPSRRLPSLRLVQQAGGRLPVAQIEELAAAQPHAQVHVMYGQTEATARLSHLPPERLVDKVGSIGKGMPGVELRVLDDSGRPVQPGVTGEIVACGENISPGYYNDPEGSLGKFRDGALHTGDLARVDKDGFIYIVDRMGGFIKSWGNRVSSQEIEDCALMLPEVEFAAAVGVPDPLAGEAVALFVSARAEITSEEIRDFMRVRLAKHMVPKHIHVIPEMPLNANGKVIRSGLVPVLEGRAG